MTANRLDAATDAEDARDAASELAPSELDADRNRWDRIATTALGGTLLAAGLRRRSIGGVAMAAAGSWLCYRGVRGTDTLSRALEAGTASESSEERLDARTPTAGPGVSRSITVGKPAEELTEYWRDPDHLSQIVSVADVRSIGDDRYRLTAEGPLGWGLSWDMELAEERPDELLRFASLEGGPMAIEGSLRFRPAPGDRGTEVTLELRVDPPGGPVGNSALEYLDIVPETLAGTTLRRFKSLAETGEIPTLENNPSARGKGDLV